MTASPPTETLTIRLPAASARRLHRVAEIARRPVDDVIAEVLDAGLQPLLEVVPDLIQDALARMEGLDDDALWERFRPELGPEDLGRYDALLEVKAARTLDGAGRATLGELRARADRLMFEKAYAALLLKWRGQRVPSLADLESSVREGELW